MCNWLTFTALLEVVVFNTCFPNTSNIVTVLAAFKSVSMNKVPLETGFGYTFKPAIEFWLVLREALLTYAQLSAILTSSNSTFPVPAVALPPCLNVILAIDAGAAVVPVLLVAEAVGSVESKAGLINRLAVFVVRSYFTTAKTGVLIGKLVAT